MMVMISGEELRSGFGGGEHVHESCASNRNRLKI